MKIVKVLTNFINKPIKLDLRPIDRLSDDFASITKELSDDVFTMKKISFDNIKADRKQSYKFYPNSKANLIKLLNESGMVGSKTSFDEIDSFLLKQGKNITK